MSVSRVVYFSSALAPSVDRWNEAIATAGFPTRFEETDFELDDVEGFVAMNHEGIETGFELFFEPSDERELEPRVREAIGARDAALAFVTHSDMRGLATAVVAAAALATLTGGVVHDEESDELVLASDALAAARELLESIRGDL